jgi:hypothetical protein
MSYEKSIWLPPSRPTTDANGFPLPLMPTVEVKSACYVYGPGETFRLHHDATSPEDFIDVKLVKPLQVGYGMNSQVVVANVQRGPERLRGKSVILRIFDPLYVSPDLLRMIFYIGERLKPMHSPFR